MAIKQSPPITDPSAEASTVAEQLFAGGGEMGARMRALDWADTALGPVSFWPQSLRIAVRILLGSGYPMLICWGPEYTMLYNDAYRPVLGQTKHPGALGRSCQEVFPEAWDFIGPLFGKVMTRGEDASTLTDQLFLLNRNGYLEECYFTFSYSPVPNDEGDVGGVFVTALETTQRVLEDRRRHALRTLASRLNEARTEEDVWRIAAQTATESPLFLPFVLLYSCRAENRAITLTSFAGISASALRVTVGDFDSPTGWPFAQILASGGSQLISDLGRRFEQIPISPWKDPVESACIMPIQAGGRGQLMGFLIAGLNPRREFDEGYRQGLAAIADQIANAIIGARAYEHERRRAEELGELDRAKTVFFSNVSHELRTPLTLLLGPLEEMIKESGEALSHQDRDRLQVARRNALRLLKLVNTLLDFSRIEAGRVQATYELTEISTYTTEIASVFRSAMESAGLTYSVDCDLIPAPVYVDRDMWEKIVLNLLSNAFKYTFEGEVSVRLRLVGDSVEFSVSDTGIGIASDELPRIFDRFHRIENVRARTHEGTGIGLALVSELARLHGGTVRVESSVGRGSTFVVILPTGKAHLPADRIGLKATPGSTALSGDTYIEEVQRWLPQDSGAVPWKTAVPLLPPVPSAADSSALEDTIIVADDNADMREYLVRLLGKEYKIHAVSNGIEALDAARRIRPALVLVDVMMPGMDGLSIVRVLREDPTFNNVPVIVVSARAGEEARAEGLQSGADDYLVKPFTARELTTRVSAHIKIAKIRREAWERESALLAAAELERHRLQELLAQAPAAIGLVNGPEHRWTYVNDLYIRVTGRKSARDFLGKSIREALPEIEGQGFFELLDQVYATGEPFVGREMKATLNRSADSGPEDAYFNFVYQPILNAAGATEGILIHAVEVTDEVLARQHVELSEGRLRLAQAAGHIGTWEWDPIHSTQALSEELRRIFGLEQNKGNDAEVWASRVFPEDVQRVRQLMEDGHRSGEMDFEYRYLHPDLGLRWLHCKGGRAPGDAAMFGVVIDVTERKQTERALRQNEERLRAIIETTPECVKIVAPEGTLLQMNSAGLSMVGATRAEMVVGRNICDIIAAEDRERFREFNERICAGSRETLEFDIIDLNGVRHHMESHAVPLYDLDGTTAQLAVTRDVTSRKLALVASQRLAAIVESSDDAIVSKDLQGIVTSWNRCAEQMFGFTAEEMIGQSITKIIPEELQAGESDILATIARGDRIQHFETIRRTKGGELIEVSLTISPVKDEAGRIVGAAKIARDITQQKKTERALRTAERLAAVGRLASTVAHEMNNPLEAITNLVYLARTAPSQQEATALLVNAEEELRRVSLITRQTLGFYRETTGSSVTKLGSLIEPLISIFHSRCSNKSISIETEIRQDPDIRCLPGEIRQLFANLLGNSVDAVPSGGRIRIRLSAAREWSGSRRPGARLTVADSGPGIPASVKDKLFEPFFTTKKDVGTGLGLWISKNIIENHTGHIRVRSSVVPGRTWTVFSVFFPSDLDDSEVLRKPNENPT